MLGYALLIAGPVGPPPSRRRLRDADRGFAPQLNAHDLAPLVKNVAFMVFILLYLRYLVDYMGAELA